MPSPRPDPRRSRASRSSTRRHARPPRRPRRGLGLWPVTAVLSVTLVVLVAMLAVREQGGSVATTESADAESVTLTTAEDRPGSAASGARARSGDERTTRRSDRATNAKGGRTRRATAPDEALRPTVANGLLCRPTPGRPALVRRRAGGSSKRVALTFDDGPTAKHTPRVLDVLREADVPATFFVIGAQVKANPELTRRIVRDGHALANHTWSHADVSEGDAAANTQLMDTQYAIQLAVGRAGCLMRPPRGAVGPGLERWLREHRKVGVLWDVDSHDYQRPSAAAMTRRVVSATRAGSIILLHDGGGDRANTVGALPGIIARLKAKGYELVTVPELLKLPRAKTETT